MVSYSKIGKNKVERIIISANSNIEEKIRKVLLEHDRNHYKQADYLILGPREYLLLTAKCQVLKYTENIGYPEKYLGLQIVLVPKNGISLGFKDQKEWALKYYYKKPKAK